MKLRIRKDRGYFKFREFGTRIEVPRREVKKMRSVTIILPIHWDDKDVMRVRDYLGKVRVRIMRYK